MNTKVLEDSTPSQLALVGVIYLAEIGVMALTYKKLRSKGTLSNRQQRALVVMASTASSRLARVGNQLYDRRDEWLPQLRLNIELLRVALPELARSLATGVVQMVGEEIQDKRTLRRRRKA